MSLAISGLSLKIPIPVGNIGPYLSVSLRGRRLNVRWLPELGHTAPVTTRGKQQLLRDKRRNITPDPIIVMDVLRHDCAERGPGIL
jgi:hypothetical protein